MEQEMIKKNKEMNKKNKWREELMSSIEPSVGKLNVLSRMLFMHRNLSTRVMKYL